MDEYVGFIKMFAGSFAPKGWAFCQGQVLQVQNYRLLFAVIGNTYGGAGEGNFALPDLRGRCPLGVSVQHPLGEKTGYEGHNLQFNNLPKHVHTLPESPLQGEMTIRISDNIGNTEGGKGRAIAHTPPVLSEQFPCFFERQKEYKSGNVLVPETVNTEKLIINGKETGEYGSDAVKPVGINNPFLGINYIICLEGMLPPKPAKQEELHFSSSS